MGVCQEGLLAALQLLLLRLPVDAADWHHTTALHWAAMRCRPATVRLLLAHGAQGAASNTGETPLHLARRDRGTESCRATAALLKGSPSGASWPGRLLPLDGRPQVRLR